MSTAMVVTLDLPRRIPSLVSFGGARRAYHSVRPGLPPRTDFRFLKNARVLFVIDDDNIRISLAEHGAELSYRSLLRSVLCEAQSVIPRVILTAPAGDHRRELHLVAAGWKALPVPHEIVQTAIGPRKMANADLDIAFEAARLAQLAQLDAVVIGTGDGDLGLATARGLRRIGVQRVYSLSVTGSTSARLTGSALFDRNVLVGRDLAGSAGIP